MKKIGNIREKYDIITEKDDSDTRKLTSLVRAGLFDQKKLPMLKRALEKDPAKMTMAERKALLELLDSLMSQVLHSQAVYSKVKQNVGSDMNEAVKDYYGADPRFGNSAAVSERDMPTIIILKRKSIRVYPDNQKVGLYYSQYLDRYVAIPFGGSRKNTPFTAINEEVNWEKAYSDLKKAGHKDDKDDELDKDPKTLTHQQHIDRLQKIKNVVKQKAAEGKVKYKHYSGSDPESKELKKITNKAFNKRALSGEISPMDWAAGRTGVAVGSLIRKGSHGIRDAIRKIRNKPTGSERIATPPSPPDRSKGPWGERPTRTVPAVQQKKSKRITIPKVTSKPQTTSSATAPKVTSTGGKVTASFGSSMNAPITARVSTPEPTASKVKKVTPKKVAQVSKPQTPVSTPEPTVPAVEKTPIRKAVKKKWRASMREEFKQKLQEKRKIQEVSVGDVADTAADIVVPFYSAAKNFKQGNYGKAALDAAIDVGAGLASIPTGGGAWAARTAVKGAIKAGERAAVSGVEKAGEKALVSGAEKAGEKAAVSGAEKVAAKPSKLTRVAKGAGRVVKGAAKIGAGVLGAALGAAGSSSSSTDDKKELTPAKSDFKAKLNTPQSDSTKTGVDTRTSNLYRKSFETPVKEEVAKDDDEKKTTRRLLKPAASINSKVKLNAAKPAGVTTGVDARMRKYERDFYGQQNEDVLSQIEKMIKEDITEMQLNIGENSLKINNTIAKKVIDVYESLNDENRIKMKDMLNEGSTESFIKLINFAVRQ